MSTQLFTNSSGKSSTSSEKEFIFYIRWGGVRSFLKCIHTFKKTIGAEGREIIESTCADQILPIFGMGQSVWKERRWKCNSFWDPGRRVSFVTTQSRDLCLKTVKEALAVLLHAISHPPSLRAWLSVVRNTNPIVRTVFRFVLSLWNRQEESRIVHALSPC